MINIKEAIESSDYYSLTYIENVYSDVEEKGVETALAFQIRCHDLYQMDMSSAGLYEAVTEINIDSNIWVLNMDVINLNKTTYGSDDFRRKIRLLDDEGFEFVPVNDEWAICTLSQCGKNDKLNTFGNQILKPKIRKNGGLAFELPDYFDDLFIHVEGGKIEAI